MEFKTTLINTSLLPIERYLLFQADSLFLILLMTSFHICKLLELSPTFTAKLLNGRWSLQQDSKEDAELILISLKLLQYILLLKKFSFKSDTISKPLSITFIPHKFSKLPFPIIIVSSANYNMSIETS